MRASSTNSSNIRIIFSYALQFFISNASR